MKFLMAALLSAIFCYPAAAENCTRSLDYILNTFVGELPRPASSYQKLFQICLETTTLSNVQDAYILKDGGIAVIPRDSAILATASTLAQFCRMFPDKSLRFINRRESKKGLTTGLVVMMPSTGSDSCKTIR